MSESLFALPNCEDSARKNRVAKTFENYADAKQSCDTTIDDKLSDRRCTRSELFESDTGTILNATTASKQNHSKKYAKKPTEMKSMRCRMLYQGRIPAMMSRVSVLSRDTTSSRAVKSSEIPRQREPDRLMVARFENSSERAPRSIRRISFVVGFS